MSAEATRIAVEVVSVRSLAPDIARFELVRCDGSAFPPVAAGAHVAIHMAPGLSRPYSLLNSGPGLRRLAVAVKLEPESQGGSRFMHTQVAESARLEIDPPRNNFPLACAPEPCVFIAGGIGITPIWAMIQECERRGQPWALHYAARSREGAALVDILEGFPQTNLVFSDRRTARLDIAQTVARAPAAAHLYCCGPSAMIADFRRAAAARPSAQVHFESFTPAAADAARRAIEVTLARSGRTIRVSPEMSICEALLQAGVRIPTSCRQGDCGTCEVDVVAGEPDHRDQVLTDDERRANTTIITCCSWSKSDRLVLDL